MQQGPIFALFIPVGEARLMWALICERFGDQVYHRGHSTLLHPLDAGCSSPLPAPSCTTIPDAVWNKLLAVPTELI